MIEGDVSMMKAGVLSERGMRPERSIFICKLREMEVRAAKVQKNLIINVLRRNKSKVTCVLISPDQQPASAKPFRIFPGSLCYTSEAVPSSKSSLAHSGQAGLGLAPQSPRKSTSGGRSFKSAALILNKQ